MEVSKLQIVFRLLFQGSREDRRSHDHTYLLYALDGVLEQQSRAINKYLFIMCVVNIVLFRFRNKGVLLETE